MKLKAYRICYCLDCKEVYWEGEVNEDTDHRPCPHEAQLVLLEEENENDNENK